MSEIKHHLVTAADGARIHVQETGAGEPVLLIPGLGFGAWSFTGQVDKLAPVARVLAIDNRGVGRSDKPPGPYSIEQLAEDAYTALVRLDALPAHVVGTSLGGYVAQTLAVKYPTAVRSLTLIATTSGGPGAHRVPARTLRAWMDAAPLGAEGFARATMPRSFAPDWVEEHPTQYQRLLALRLVTPTPLEAWQAQFAAGADFFTHGTPAGAITVPTTIIHGTADRIVPYANAAHTARRIPHARRVTLPDAGHLCWIEEASLVNDLIASPIIGTEAIVTR